MFFKELLCFAAPALAFASIFSDVRGIVHDPDHRPVAGARVTLRAAQSDWSKATETSPDGGFEFAAVPAGEYRVSVAREGFAPVEMRVTAASGSAPVLHFQLQLAASAQSVEVSEHAAEVDLESSATATTVGHAAIERTPGADRTNSLAMITNFVPGAYVTHDLLHIRGGHQVSWLVDGVPVPNTNIATNVGPQFDPKDIDLMEIETGAYSAEYGDRTYGVFNVIPRTGFERNNEGEFVATLGSFFETNDQLSFGSHTERFAYYASVNGNRTDLGLETPGPAIRHDRSNGEGGMGTLVFNADPADQLRLVTSARRDFYQIPLNPGQPVSDTENESDAFVNFSWVRTARPGALLTVSPFYHFNRADYAGGPADLPVSPEDNHDSSYAGAQVSLAAVSGKHNARAGVYGFAESDHTLFGVQANDGSGASLRQKENVAGNLEAVFLEDQYKPASWLMLTGGLRLTHFSGSLSENAASPRAGASLRIPGLRWILRGFYGRYYQAPPLSTVSGPLLAYAADQGFGFLPLRGERDQEREVGLTAPIGGWTLGVTRFSTSAQNYFDHNSLGNSNLFFPLTVAGARIRGWEATLRSPRLLHRGQIHVAYSNQHAEGVGAITGGLTDFSPPQAVFLLDHDQRHTLNAGADVNLPGRSWAAANVYYGSGFADNGGPAHLPHHTTFDLSLGKSFGERWSAAVHGLNVANRRFLLDNSETFGGTHYFDSRQIYAEIRYRFRY